MSHAWMPFYVADYLADTTHLSTVEHGAYRHEHGRDPPTTSGRGGTGRHWPKAWVDQGLENSLELPTTGP